MGKRKPKLRMDVDLVLPDGKRLTIAGDREFEPGGNWTEVSLTVPNLFTELHLDGYGDPVHYLPVTIELRINHVPPRVPQKDQLSEYAQQLLAGSRD